jgi:hypothetical protein
LDQHLDKILEGALMTCQKCQGLMIEEQRPELSPDMVGHRCVNCGLYLDPLVQHNRKGAAGNRAALVRAA